MSATLTVTDSCEECHRNGPDGEECWRCADCQHLVVNETCDGGTCPHHHDEDFKLGCIEHCQHFLSW